MNDRITISTAQRGRTDAVWYIRDEAGRYYTGSAWSTDRRDSRLYVDRPIAVLVRRAIGGYLYRT